MDILLICRNNERYFKTLFPKIINELREFDYRCFIYENNSDDNTKKILEQIKAKHNNIFIKVENNYRDRNRYINICRARNSMLAFYKQHLNPKYKNVILLDTNILFTKNTLFNLFKYKDLIKEGVMFLPFTKYILENNLGNKGINKEYYYDLLALNYGDYFMIENSGQLTFDELKFKLVNKYKKIVNGKISYSNKIISNNVLELETGSGGLMLLNRDVYIKYGWHLIRSPLIKNKNISPNIVCEHWNFCQNITEHGKIILVRDARSEWYRDRDL